MLEKTGGVNVMKTNNTITTIALWVNRVVAASVFVLLFFVPGLIRWYSGIRLLTLVEQRTVGACFYACVIPVQLALWQLDRLLAAILAERVFVRENVRRIRIIQWCCLAVSILCIPAAVAYLPLIFLVLIMAFLFLVVCVLTRVMDAAVAIREENDLTI